MAAKSGRPGQQLIDLTKLNLMQLTQFKNQLDQDLQFYQESLQNLKHAQTKFSESGEAVKQIPSSSSEKEILVPLTGSMYVPGKLADPDKVLVDVGTGYYVEKERPAATEYFSKKVKYVSEQMEKVQALASEKMKVREAVAEVMEVKLQQQFAQQRAATASASTSSS